VALESALNCAMQAIAPVTLGDLRSGWDPFRKGSKPSLSKLFFVVVSLAIMVVAGYYTQQYNRGGMILIGLKEVQDAHPAEQVGKVARTLLAGEPEIRRTLSSGENAVVNEAYFRLLDDLHALDSKMSLYVPLAYDFLVETERPFVAQLQGAADVPQQYASLPPSLCPASAEAAAVQPATETPALQGDDQVSARLQIFLRDNSRQIAQFVCAEDIHFHPRALAPIEFLVTSVTDRLRLVGLWILPGLYGALGAMIFYMRAILNPLLPDPPLARIVHRVALGAFAGVIIAWFWAPAAQKAVEFANIGFNLFGVAFLIGFSIEVFFAFLDRAVASITNAVNKIGR
jgi:hypothetical protein